MNTKMKSCIICKNQIYGSLYKVRKVKEIKYYCCNLCYHNISYGYK